MRFVGSEGERGLEGADEGRGGKANSWRWGRDKGRERKRRRKEKKRTDGQLMGIRIYHLPPKKERKKNKDN